MTGLRRAAAAPAVVALGLALAAAAPLILGGCSVNPATGEEQFTALMSPEEERRIGAQEHPRLVKALGGLANGRQIVEGETVRPLVRGGVVEAAAEGFQFPRREDAVAFCLLERGLRMPARAREPPAQALVFPPGSLVGFPVPQKPGKQQCAWRNVYAAGLHDGS